MRLKKKLNLGLWVCKSLIDKWNTICQAEALEA